MNIESYRKSHSSDSFVELCMERDRLIDLMRMAEKNIPIEEDYFHLFIYLSVIADLLVEKAEPEYTELELAREMALVMDEDGRKENLIEIANFILEKDVMDTTLNMDDVVRYVKGEAVKRNVLLDNLDNMYKAVPFKNSYDFIVHKKSRAMSDSNFEQLRKQLEHLQTVEMDETDFRESVEQFRKHWDEANKK